MRKGSKMTEEQRRRLSEAHLGKNLGHPVSEETRRKISESQKGKVTPLERRLKISSSLKGRKMPYVAEANKSRIYSESTRKLRSQVAKNNWSNPEYRIKMTRKGENNPNYIKDRSLLKTDILRPYDTQYKYWMFAVKKRDGWTCRMSNDDCRGRLEAHHILPWKDFPELHYQINNGITLCVAHHPRGRAEVKRLSEFFKSLVSETKDNLSNHFIKAR